MLYRGVGIRSLVETIADSTNEHNGFDDQTGVALRCRKGYDTTMTHPTHENAERIEQLQENGQPVLEAFKEVFEASKEYEAAKEATNGS